MRSYSGSGFFFVLCCTVVHIGTPSGAATLRVSPNGSDEDGLSWETAFNSIMMAVSESVDGDEVWISAGVYEESVDVSKEITILGGFDGTESIKELRDHIENIVIIDGKAVEQRALTIHNVSHSIIDGLVTIGQASEGGSISVVDASPYIQNCVIRNSYSFGPGGGISFRRSLGVLDNCVIMFNISDDVGGGVASLEGSEPTLINCQIVNNIAPFAGGICVALNERGIHLINCLVLENRGDSVVGGICASIGFVNVLNSIVRGNIPTNLFAENDGGEIRLAYSNIQDGWPGEGNINEDPLFMDPENHDFRLQENSPCIDSASSVGPLTDIDGNPRPVDIPGAGRDGTGDEFDMGPYERPISGNPTHTPTVTPTFTHTPTVTPTPTNTPLPKVIHVDAAAPAGGDGTSWGTAYRTVKSAVDKSYEGDSIWIREGRYHEALLLILHGVKMLGGFPKDQPEPIIEDRDSVGHPSIIASTGITVSAIQIRQVDSGFLLDGLIVEGGKASQFGGGGGAIRIEYSSGTISNLILRENRTSERGGALRTFYSNLEMTNCLVHQNESNIGGGGLDFAGGSVINMMNCRVSDNTASLEYQQGEPVYGGGVLVEDSVFNATGCTFERNYAKLGGGFAAFGTDPEARLVNCRISENRATGIGGILVSSQSSFVMTNCIVDRNHAETELPAVWFEGLEATRFVEYCTIAGNTSNGENGGSVHFTDPQNAEISSSIIWGNEPKAITGNTTGLEVYFSLVEGGYPGVENLDADPMFLNFLNGDLKLGPNSPAIDAGSVLGPMFDFEKNPRPIDVSGVGRDGEDAYDIGAYEFQATETPTPTITPTPSITPTPTITPTPSHTPTFNSSDIDGDGHVNAIDLLILLEDMAEKKKE